MGKNENNRNRWVGCGECDDTRNLKPGERCGHCNRQVDEGGSCVQCPDVPKGSTCSECGRSRGC
jgi:hypothetical protein